MISFLILAAASQVDVRDGNAQHVHAGANGVVIRDAQGHTIIRNGAVTAVRQGGAGDYAGSGGRSDAACPGGRIEVSGASQELHVAGTCSYVELTGANNVVYATLAPGAVVELTGVRNRLIWRLADPHGRAPRVENTGFANAMTRR